MALRPAGDGHLDGLATARHLEGCREPDDAHHRAGQPHLLRTTVLHDGVETTHPPVCQYGHPRGTLHRHLFPLQHLQHVLGRSGVGRTRHRMAHVVRRLCDDHHLRTHRATHGGARQERHSLCHPRPDGTTAEDGSSRGKRLRHRSSDLRPTAWRHHRGTPRRAHPRRWSCAGRRFSLHR